LKINPTSEDLRKYLEIKMKSLWTSEEMEFLSNIEKMLPFIILEILDWRKKEGEE
jgi:hypothetical protein